MAEAPVVPSANPDAASTAVRPAIVPMPSLNDLKVNTLPEQKKLSQVTNEFVGETIQSPPKEIDKNILQQNVLAYAQQRKEEGKMLEFALFYEKDFTLEGNKITFRIESEIMLGQLLAVKHAFVDYLRSIYGHSFLIDGVVVETEQRKMLYSPTDKYNFLVQQYPELEELKKRLGLELEF